MLGLTSRVERRSQAGSGHGQDFCLSIPTLGQEGRPGNREYLTGGRSWEYEAFNISTLGKDGNPKNRRN
jgi:hypothetical protein